MFDPGPCVYMEKIAVGPDAVGSIDITASPTQNLRWVAKAKGESVRDLTVVILDRDRHHDLIDEVRSTGARIRLISDGDIYGAIATASPGAGVDVLFGIGGTPEGVVAAAALKCMGGEIQGRLWPRNDAERDQAVEAGYDLVGHPHHRRPRPGRQLLLRRHRHHRRRAAAGRPLRTGRRQHPVPRHALTVGHGPPHQRPPPARQAAGLRRRRLRLNLRRRSPLRFDRLLLASLGNASGAVAVRRPSRTHRASRSAEQPRGRCRPASPAGSSHRPRRPRRSRPWTRRPTPPVWAGGSRTPDPSAPPSTRGP